MPLSHISLRAGKPEACRQAIFDSLYRAMRETLDVPEDDQFMTITEHDAADFRYGAAFGIARSDALVLIQVTVFNTRTVEQKRHCPGGAGLNPASAALLSKRRLWPIPDLGRAQRPQPEKRARFRLGEAGEDARSDPAIATARSRGSRPDTAAGSAARRKGPRRHPGGRVPQAEGTSRTAGRPRTSRTVSPPPAAPGSPRPGALRTERRACGRSA